VTAAALLSPVPAHSQDCPAAVVGAWTGTLPAQHGFLLEFTVRRSGDGTFEAEIRSGGESEVVPAWTDGARLRFQSSRQPVAFSGSPSTDGSLFAGFIQYASHVARLVLPAVDSSEGAGASTWAASWSPLGVSNEELRLDLYIDDDGEGGLGGYFFFRDQRMTGLWGYGLECEGDQLELGEKYLGLWFEGRLTPAGTLDLAGTTAGASFPMLFERIPEEDVPGSGDAPEAPARARGSDRYVPRAPDPTDDAWTTATPSEVGIDPGPIGDLVQAVVEGDLAYTHGVLVARHGRLAIEEYFYGFDRETLHDMRSASKTITSTLVGLAVQEGRIEGSTARALAYFPQYRRYANWDPRKADMSVRHLLTMSSGLDANDSDYQSTAAEGRYQSQTARPDWIKLALDAPMLEDPGTQPLYGSANPMILGGMLANVADEPVEWFAHRTLFEPLGIDSYKFFLDPMGVVYMGGGLWMRPRDMAKYGQMYLDGGTWQGNAVLDASWIEESWQKYGALRPLARNGHQYGYLWWHHVYEVDGQTIATLEARGNGGQYIFVAPSLDLVVVITSGNFRNGRTREPEDILRRFILPAVISEQASP
jgi:CubicO group peptidase (beta-lactamase class C family)